MCLEQDGSPMTKHQLADKTGFDVLEIGLRAAKG